MTDTPEFARIRSALEAGPTPGPWEDASAGSGKRGEPFKINEYFVRRPGDDIAIAADIINPESAAPSEENAVYIAACNPAAMTAVLAHIDAQADELDAAATVVEGYRAQCILNAAEIALLRGLLGEVATKFTRDDDLPDELLPRIDVALKETP